MNYNIYLSHKKMKKSFSSKKYEENHILVWQIRTWNVKVICLLIFPSMTVKTIFLFYVWTEPSITEMEMGDL
jgi:hypothetical protein